MLVRDSAGATAAAAAVMAKVGKMAQGADDALTTARTIQGVGSGETGTGDAYLHVSVRRPPHPLDWPGAQAGASSLVGDVLRDLDLQVGYEVVLEDPKSDGGARTASGPVSYAEIRSSARWPWPPIAQLPFLRAFPLDWRNENLKAFRDDLADAFGGIRESLRGPLLQEVGLDVQQYDLMGESGLRWTSLIEHLRSKDRLDILQALVDKATGASQAVVPPAGDSSGNE
jgi:hypothetical protein